MAMFVVCGIIYLLFTYLSYSVIFMLVSEMIYFFEKYCNLDLN